MSDSAIKRNESNSFQLRKIFAFCDETTFEKFRQRALSEGFSYKDIGKAFSLLVKLYAEGAVLYLKDSNKKKKDIWSYLDSLKPEMKEGETNVVATEK